MTDDEAIRRLTGITDERLGAIAPNAPTYEEEIEAKIQERVARLKKESADRYRVAIDTLNLLPEIWKGHAEVWGREAEAIGECMVSLRNDVDLVPHQLMMELCTSIAERYEAKANQLKEAEG